MTTKSFFKPLVFASLIGCLFLISCAPRVYVSDTMRQEIGKNPTIAVLPYRLIFNGKVPKGLSEEERTRQDNEERIAFQQSLFSYLSGKTQKEPVRLISVQQSNAKLKDLGFNIYKIEDYQPQELAKALGVDAVISPTAEKYRYRSDEAAFAIGAAATIVGMSTGVWLPAGISNTNDVKANCTMTSAKSGTMIWNVSRIGQANWNYQVNNVMDDLHRRMARNIPKFDTK